MEKKTFIIAELGTSHGGDKTKARELINAAAESGADCIKCQIVFADEILHPKTGLVRLPGGEIPLYNVFKALEKDEFFYKYLKEEAEKQDLLFLATPFGIKSAALLKELQPKAVKIASPELNYTTLLEEIALWGIPIYLSSGVSTLGDIEEALDTLTKGKKATSFPQITLLHCVTAYPAPVEQYNLRLLPYLAGILGLPVGISDHSLDPVLVPALGTALGATVIEKHFCLSRDDPGLDDPIALEPCSFAKMVQAVKKAASMEADQVIKALKDEFTPGLIEEILGNGVKTLAGAERENYGRTNRSIHALIDIAKGETIQPDMIAALRTEKILKPGLHPRWEKAIAGRKAQNFIPAGEGIRFEDI